MKSTGLVVLGCLVAVLAPVALPAAAQEAILYCKDEHALIRFDGHPLPAGDTSRWAKEQPAAGNRCTLASGAEVVVRYRQTAGTPFGMGGANREAVFSMWVDGKKVVHREEFRPHAVAYGHKITMNHALYTPGRLQVCSYARGQMKFEQTDTVTCQVRRVDLSALVRDPLEPANDDAVGRMTFAAAYDPAFCESLIIRRAAPPVRGDTDTDRITLDAGDGSPFWTDMARSVETRAYDEIRIATFDMRNRGSAQTVLEISPMSGSYWGTFFMIHDGVATDDSLRAMLAVMENYYYPKELDQAAPTGWRMFQTSDDKFTNNDTFILSGTAFVLARPQYRDDRQSWTLFKPLPDGGMDTVCNFQLTGPNL